MKASTTFWGCTHPLRWPTLCGLSFSLNKLTSYISLSLAEGFFFLSLLIYFNWRTITSQQGGSPCHTGISHRRTFTPPPHHPDLTEFSLPWDTKNLSFIRSWNQVCHLSWKAVDLSPKQGFDWVQILAHGFKSQSEVNGFTCIYWIFCAKFCMWITAFNACENVLFLWEKDELWELWIHLHIHSLCAQLFSCVLLFATLWTVVHQAPLSIEFSRQECWSKLPFSTPGGSPQPRDWTHISCISRWILYHCATWEADISTVWFSK